MIRRLALLILVLFLCGTLQAQQNASSAAAASGEEILLKQAQNKQEPKSPVQDLNERLRALPKFPGTAPEYLLGSGDSIELTVVGIPGLDKKNLLLDGQGKIFVPYLGLVDVLGLSIPDVESKLSRLFAVSLLEDPQVTVSIREYRSQYYYVFGSVFKPGKYSLTQSADLLDAIAQAGGLTDKANPNIRLYRCSQPSDAKALQTNANTSEENARSADIDPPCTPFEINVPELLGGKQNMHRLAILSGDVIRVDERKERSYYVLGDILRPGAYQIPHDEPMALSQAIANAGGMLRTASGKKMVVIRRKAESELPERIEMNAYALLRGDIRDIDLRDKDIVLIPGSASKTLGKNFANNITGIFTTVLLLGVR
jgi:polysaccharide biosynthesis/export protein